MANINLNINILDSQGCPTLYLIDETDLSIVVNEGSPVLVDNSITVPVPQDSTVTIVVEKDGYDSYDASIDVAAIDYTVFISLSATVPVDFINITQSCHSFTITNNGTSSDDNVTYSITDLDGIIIGSNEDVSLVFGATEVFTSTADNIYLLIVKDIEDTIIRQYVIIDYCNILNCISNRILEIICDEDCGCGCNDCNDDKCKKDFEMKRIFLLQFDLFNRINAEYRLNSYYTTIDNIKLNELKRAQSILDKLTTYCPCNDATDINFNGVLSSSNTNSDCGCS